MMPTSTAGPSGNPFATRFIRPGRIPPFDAEGRPLSITALADRVRPPRCVVLVGPHGSGKSNLLAALAVHLAGRGAVAELRVRRGRDACGVIGAVARLPGGTIACIDGWERLGVAGRLAVRTVARWRGCGLVVTAHRPCGPILATCGTSPILLERIVAVLAPHTTAIGPDDVAAAYARQSGNLREALLDLYDLFEHRTRGGGAEVRT